MSVAECQARISSREFTEWTLILWPAFLAWEADLREKGARRDGTHRRS